jgi:hypothetical protein
MPGKRELETPLKRARKKLSVTYISSHPMPLTHLANVGKALPAASAVTLAARQPP